MGFLMLFGENNSRSSPQNAAPVEAEKQFSGRHKWC
jgi:hypothetical protein